MNAKVLSAVLVLFFCAGCAPPMPVGPASASGPPASSKCPNGYYQCEWLPTSTKLGAALIYFKGHHLKEAAGLNSNPGDWIIEDASSPIVIANPVTGFRWEGTVGWREVSLGDCCVGTMPEAYIIKESVTTVPTVVPASTGLPTPAE
jgi:hypothetical protein